MYDVTVIGPGVMDVLASPFDQEVFARDSRYLDHIRMSFGGDALNESVVLSRLGKSVQLISKVGDDEAGRSILGFLGKCGVSTACIRMEKGLDTSVNIALIAQDGSRKFLMDPHSSIRKLGPEDIMPYRSGGSGDEGKSAHIVSFASMFISPLFTIGKMKELFAAVKAAGKTLVVDVTRVKNGEKLEDLQDLLPYIDVFVPNDEEIASITGEQDPEKNVRLLVEAGVRTAVVKIGSRGCLVGTRCQAEAGDSGIASTGFSVKIVHVGAVPGIRCVDTTGAGDTFAAGFIAGLCNGWTATECARLGCAAASCSIEQIGATDGVHSLDQVMERYYRIK